MTTRLLFLVLALVPAACHAAPEQKQEVSQVARAPEAVTLRALDGVVLHGLFHAAPRPKATILLFHQAGSNKSEYATIAPRLAEAGYSALAIDQRSGGELFGARNATVDGVGKSSGYGDAIPDLEATIAWAKAKGSPVILWGSSYSSALVFPVAAKHDAEVAAILAFSPGEYIDGVSIKGAAAKLRAPVFVTSAKDDEEIAAAKAIFDASPSADKTQFVPKSSGVHGSSTLIAARNANGAEENWAAVLAFLARVAP